MAAEVLAEAHDGVGILTLNRPAKINALTRRMVADLSGQLQRWRADPRVAMVLLRGAGPRGFCAGGDIRAFHEAITTGRHREFLDFLAEEFRLDALIASYPKPVIAVMDGLCMGGGVGLAGHAAVRIVTPRSAVGMPETRIGYSPDVGGTHLLGAAPGRLGEHLALTAATMGAADAIHAGFADFCVAEADLEDVLATLPDLAGLGAGELSMALEILHASPAPADGTGIAAQQPWIDAAYSADTVPGILAVLDSYPLPQAAAAAAAIRANSPLATQTALQAVRAARREDDLPAALEREHRIAAFLMQHPDLPEGIRAQVIDRDRAPRWNPADPAAVDLGAIAALMTTGT